MKKAFFILFVLLFLFTPNAWSGGISGAGGGFANGVQDFFQNYNQGQQNVRANEALRLERERLEFEKKAMELEQQQQQRISDNRKVNANQYKNIDLNNGTAWNDFNDMMKIFYIYGCISSSTYITTGSLGELIDTDDKENEQIKKLQEVVFFKPDKKKMFSRDEMEVFSKSMFNLSTDISNVSIQRYAMSGITIGQMISGLDELYKDYKNVNIYIQEAIYVVKKQINGSSSEEIEAILQYLRSGRDYNKLNYTDKDGRIKKANFP